MMEPDDTRRARVLTQLARSLALIPEPETVLGAIRDAVDCLEASEGADAATDFVAAMMELVYDAGLVRQAFALAHLGLARVGARRDARWAHFTAVATIEREVSDPQDIPAALDTPERWQAGRLLASEPAHCPGYAWTYIPYADRDDALQRQGRVYLTGEYRQTALYLSSVAEHEEREGRITRAVGIVLHHRSVPHRARRVHGSTGMSGSRRAPGTPAHRSHTLHRHSARCRGRVADGDR